MWINSGDDLNRRVEVENVLLNVAAGKRPMLTKDECRKLAYKLGIPSHFNSGAKCEKNSG